MKLHIMEQKENLRTHLLEEISKQAKHPAAREDVTWALFNDVKHATLCLELSEEERAQLCAKPSRTGHFPTYIPMNGKFYYILFKRKD